MRVKGWLISLLLAITIINYPNPFNPKGGEINTFECTSDTTLETSIYIYNMSAQLITQKSFSISGGATNRLTWNGYGDNNSLCGNGVYLYRLINASTKQSLAKGKVWIINK